MVILGKEIAFPSITESNEDGLLALGGDLTPQRLLLAYRSGIFPWYSDGEPILWWSPHPRMVLFPKKLKISKSMKKLLKEETFNVTFNENFEEVIKQCAKSKREGEEGTWITTEMQEAYIKLYKMGIAKSVEVWRKDSDMSSVLVGGLYGIDLGDIFCGESMFALESNASKYGFIKWIQHIEILNYKLIDCQVYTRHLESLGAEMISREKFISFLPS